MSWWPFLPLATPDFSARWWISALINAVIFALFTRMFHIIFRWWWPKPVKHVPPIVPFTMAALHEDRGRKSTERKKSRIINAVYDRIRQDSSQGLGFATISTEADDWSRLGLAHEELMDVFTEVGYKVTTKIVSSKHGAQRQLYIHWNTPEVQALAEKRSVP